MMFLCVVLLMGISVALAGNKPKDAKRSKTLVTTVFVTDVDCQHCVQKVMNTIPFEPGVKDVVPDLAAKKITVTYDAAKNSDEGLVAAFAGIKVKAEKEVSR